MKTFQERIDAELPLPPQYHEIPDRPDVASHLIRIWTEFFELSTERQIGMAVGSIPASKIRERARELGIDTEEEADRFFTLIRKMDDAYLAPRPTAETDDKTGTGDTKRPLTRGRPRRKKL